MRDSSWNHTAKIQRIPLMTVTLPLNNVKEAKT